MTEKQPKPSAEEIVSSDEYRKILLEKICNIAGFECLVNYSRDPRGIGACDITPGMIAAAKAIIASSSRAELRVARQHFNTVHLLAFWKRYGELIDKGVAAGALPSKSPLFTTGSGGSGWNLNLVGIPDEYFDSGLYRAASDGKSDFKYVPMQRQKAKRTCTIRADIFQSLHGRLAYVLHLVRRSATRAYNEFLLEERAAGSSIWEAYQAHIFLDVFLYDPDHPGFGQSKFDAIFFASNFGDLIFFLRESMNLKKPLRIPAITEFLKRQTKYNLRLSQEISLEDNHARNHHRQLLRYDHERGFVHMDEMPAYMAEEYHRLFRENLMLDDLGCPFGRTKGVHKNALVEVYDYFDKLFLHSIGRSWEFRALFDK